MKKLLSGILVILLVLFSSPSYNVYAEEEVSISSSGFVDIKNSSALSASGISGYAIDSKEEFTVPMSSTLKTLAPSSGSYIPQSVDVELSTKQIIGNDDRTRVTNTTAFPNCAIGRIEMTFPNNKTYVGTAWMYGNKVAVTAGHCVYSKADGGWAKSVAFYPGKNGTSSPLGVYYATQLYTDTKYTASENSNYDWGMLRFGTNVGAKTGYFGAEWTSGSQVGINVTVRGYPGEKSSQMWTASGKITGSGTSKTNYSIDTTGGQSGAPVYNSSYIALAIHTNSISNYNQGERIDQSLFNIINDARKW